MVYGLIYLLILEKRKIYGMNGQDRLIVKQFIKW